MRWLVISHLIRIYTVCHSVFWCQTETPICISGHVQILGWNSPLQKLRDERVKLQRASDSLPCELQWCLSRSVDHLHCLLVDTKQNHWQLHQTGIHQTDGAEIQIIKIGRISAMLYRCETQRPTQEKYKDNVQKIPWILTKRLPVSIRNFQWKKKTTIN